MQCLFADAEFARCLISEGIMDLYKEDMSSLEKGKTYPGPANCLTSVKIISIKQEEFVDQSTIAISR